MERKKNWYFLEPTASDKHCILWILLSFSYNLSRRNTFSPANSVLSIFEGVRCTCTFLFKVFNCLKRKSSCYLEKKTAVKRKLRFHLGFFCRGILLFYDDQSKIFVETIFWKLKVPLMSCWTEDVKFTEIIEKESK